MEFWRRQKDPPGGRDDMEISTLRMGKTSIKWDSSFVPIHVSCVLRTVMYGII